jgi:4-hydroxybenzoate polyprenyltransferase
MLQKIFSYCYLTRLNKPIGWLILLWPTLMALWLASEGKPKVLLVGVFTLGVIVMRSLGCIINDLADRKLDGHVPRTQHRPLVTQAVSVREAIALAIFLTLIAFLLVTLTNLLTVKLSFVALGLACLYPFMKRVTFYPQVFLGAAFGFAVPMAYAAASNTLPISCWLLFLAILIWPVAYDTAYAMVDREADLKIGIKSTAIVFGRWDKFWIGICHFVVIILLGIIGWLNELSWPFYVSLCVCAGLAGYQQYLIKNREPEKCFQAFLNNHWFGLSFFVGTVLGYV